VRWSCKDCNRLDPHQLTDMTKVVLRKELRWPKRRRRARRCHRGPAWTMLVKMPAEW